jgi:hypothetical protein
MWWVIWRGRNANGLKLQQLLLEPHRQIGMCEGLAYYILRKDTQVHSIRN